MAYQISFGTLTDVQKLEAADLDQKINAIDAAMADIQTERAGYEVVWRDKTNALQTEKAKIITQLRTLRAASIVQK